MKSAILTVGTEILFGSILNTNAQYLSEQLRLIGHDVMYHFTVGDNPGRLKDLLAYAYHDCDLVITTGAISTNTPTARQCPSIPTMSTRCAR